MDLSELLKGRKVRVMTDVKVEVELEISEVIESKHSRDLEEATRENDYWPKSQDWTTIDVKFTNGYKKSYQNFSEIKLAD